MKRVAASVQGAERLPLKHSTPGAVRLARSFASDQAGGIGLFMMICFFLMVLMGGMAVDLMRYEYTRTALQQTADRSSLAAAALSQDLKAEVVVADYFDKDNKFDYLTGVTVDEGLNYKTVTVDAKLEQPTYFMNLLGIKTLNVPASSTAEERITNVEISLVLDISGSMDGSGANPQKLTNLKNAAKQFVTDVLAKDNENRVSIAIVPYNGQVNLGPDLWDKYPGIYDKPNLDAVYCVDLPSGVYSQAGLSTSTSLPATGWADTFSGTAGKGASYDTPSTTTYYGPTNTSGSSYYTPNDKNKWCPQNTANYIRLPSNNVATLKSNIEALDAIGATSINAGIKWGLTLLDPGSRTMFTQLRSAGKIPKYFTDRPFDYTDNEAMKVIVLMTDGENFAEERLNDGYRTGASPIFFDTSSKNLSIYHPSYTGSGTNKYYYPSNNSWQAIPLGATTTQSCSNNKCTQVVKPGTSVQLSWQQVWYGFDLGGTKTTGLRASYVAWQLYARAFGTNTNQRSAYYDTYIDAIRTRTSTTDMDTQLQKICTLAKNKGVIIYGIAFEAPSGGQTQIAKCAAQASEQNDPKASAYYFQSNGSKIGTDFKTIASNISQLRLTQ